MAWIKSPAQTFFYHYDDSVRNVKATAMSPNGKYVVGIDYKSVKYGNTYATGYGSFFWNIEDDKREWMMEADVNDFEKMGSFADVNDKGMIVGHYKNPENTISIILGGVESTMPINTAALWQDGKLYDLGLGSDLKKEECNKFEDGTKAVAISNDGAVIVGNYVVKEASHPCAWKLNKEGEWVYEALSMVMPDSTVSERGSVTGVSGDGRVIVGDVYDAKSKSDMPAFWIDGKLNVIFPVPEDKELGGSRRYCSAMAVSPNGEYISLRFKKKFLAVYSVSQNAYLRAETVLGSTNIVSAPVDNEGNIMATFNCGSLMSEGGVYFRLMRFSASDGSLVDFSYFASVYAPGVEFPFNIDVDDKPGVMVSSVSSDGITLLGNNNEKDEKSGQRVVSSAWVLKVNSGDVKVPSVPTGVKARFTDNNQVTVTWPAIIDENYTLQSYNVYQNAKLVATIEAADSIKVYSYVTNTPGKKSVAFKVSALYSVGGGKTIESPKSETVVLPIPNKIESSFFEDFENDGWNTNFWTFSKDIEGENIASTWGYLPYVGLINFAGVTVRHFEDSPYSLSAVSRPIDASEISGNIILALSTRIHAFKGMDLNQHTDTLSLEVSSDWGNEWKEVAAFTSDNLTPVYTFVSADITEEVAGKTFQFRLRAHGSGISAVQFYVDQISVQEEKDYAPSGLTAIDKEDGSRQIRWKNSYDAYELTYMPNPYGDISGMTIGNNGNEIIGASVYDADMLAQFDGSYITTVTTSLNWYGDKENASLDSYVMVWQGDQLIREQKFDVKTFNEFNVIKLDEPVKIDASKEYKIGIKVNNYPVSEMPLLYFQTTEYQTAKTDLFSEDGGNTWGTLKEVFAGTERPEDGYGIWKISVGVSDEAEADVEAKYDDKLFAYNIYRDGEKINDELIYVLGASFTEEDAPETGLYEVRGYYIDGGATAVSEPLSYVATAIDSEDVEKTSVVYDAVKDIITVNGEFNRMSLYTVDGIMVMSTTESSVNVGRLAKGTYILMVENKDNNHTSKLLVR